MRTTIVLAPSSFEATAHAVCNQTVPFFLKVAAVVGARVVDVSVAPAGLGCCFVASFLLQSHMDIWIDDNLVNCSFSISCYSYNLEIKDQFVDKQNSDYSFEEFSFGLQCQKPFDKMLNAE